MLTSSPGELLSSLEGLVRSLFANLNFFVGLNLGTASVSPCWNTQGWETITEVISAHVWDLQVLWATAETGRRWKMKGPLLSTSFQHPLSQQGHGTHLVATGSQQLADNTQRGKDLLSVHISLFCYLCWLKGRCEGRQKLEAVLLQLSQHKHCCF